MRAIAHASNRNNVMARACRGAARRESGMKKTLDSCGFLRSRKTRPVARKISRATRAAATRWTVIT
jgi:hypothetical protein